jgi:hypothetical protein
MFHFHVFEDMVDIAGSGIFLPGRKTQEEHAIVMMVEFETFPNEFPAKFGVQIGT